MLKLVAFFLTLCLLSASVPAQDLPINGAWKFKTGDQPDWASPTLNDSSWTPINIAAPWETQGYKGYDGFAWYRRHIIIPSSIKDKAFLKEKIRFDLGKIDDGDEFFLNGILIGRNAGRGGTIQTGDWSQQRSYSIPLTDARIRWDQDNVIAIRVYDHDGDGGMYDGKYGISVMDVTDYISLNMSADEFHFSGAGSRQLSKKIVLLSTSEKFDFTGRLNIRVIDPFSGTAVYKQTIGADFAHDRPFEYTIKTSLPELGPYRIEYSFEEGRSKKIVTAAEEVPYILTPAAGASPRINGAETYGVRPGAPFLYRIPVTGERPVIYAAAGLPPTLTLDKATGIITGSLPGKGSYPVQLTAKNKAGTTTRKFTIVCGDRIALTPALGWNSWNCWGLSVSDEKVKTSAAAMSAKLADHGWSYINIDDGWEDKRDDKGEIMPNKKFPDMKGLCDHVHSLGLKIGIYSSPGPRTCGGYLGSYQHEEQDAAAYARWGIDYLKYDWCSYGEIAPKAPTLEDEKKPYILMRQALDKTGRDILYSLCQYGMGDVWKWGGEIGASSWRTTGDITDTWGSMAGIGFNQDKAAPYTAPGNFNDPDMLVVGRVGWGPSLHNARLTPDEQYTHISLWSLLSAPLLIGCDMGRLDDFTLGLLTNDEVLSVDQDALARPAKKVWEKDKIEIWVKELKDGSKALGIFNRSELPAKPVIPYSSIGLPAHLKVRDLWRQQNITSAGSAFTPRLPAHGCVLLKISTAPRPGR
jgi:alpha-galactosidase